MPGLFYRSATLYHPQRRAILHLKTQKKKIKDKNKSKEDIPPFFDTTCLKSKTIQIILLSTGFGALGVNTPLYYLVNQLTQDGYRERSVVMMMIFLAAGWTLGCCVFGCLVLQRSLDCRIGRQYLCQASLLVSGLSILALTSVKVGKPQQLCDLSLTQTVQGYYGYVTFVWVYGIFTGGYSYTLKMYVYQKVRARNFAKAWGYVQCSQALPNMFGIPLAGYINIGEAGAQIRILIALELQISISISLFVFQAGAARPATTSVPAVSCWAASLYA